jgi:hypothetical protein
MLFSYIHGPATDSDEGCVPRRTSNARFFQALVPDYRLPHSHVSNPHLSCRHQYLDRSRFPRQSPVGPHITSPEDNFTAYYPDHLYYRGNGLVLFHLHVLKNISRVWLSSCLFYDFLSRSVIHITYGPYLTCMCCQSTYVTWTLEEASWAASKILPQLPFLTSPF